MTKLVFLLVVLVVGGYPDSLTVTDSNESCFGNNFFNCSVDFGAQQFNPALGTLNSVDWSFAAAQNIVIDVDNCFLGVQPALLDYSYSITAGDSVLGGSQSETVTSSGQTYGGCAGGGNIGYGRLQSFGGTITDVTPFLGAGTDVATTQLLTINSFSLTGGDRLVGTAIYINDVDDTLSLTYNYTPVGEVPEPSEAVVLTILLGMAMVVFTIRQRRTRR